MAQRDPFSWASEYAQTQHGHAARENQNAQNALMSIFQQEASRQRPYSDLPVDLAKRNAATQNSYGNFVRKEEYKAAAKANAPIAPDEISSLITDAAKAHGLDPDIMLTVAGIESNFNPRAKNPRSSAGGLWQQIDSNAAQYGVRDRFNPIDSTAGAMRYASDINRTLAKAGLPINAGTVYLAWQQGPAGAVRLLSNPNASAESIVGADAVRLNGGRPGMSAKQFADLWMRKAESQYASRVRNKQDYVRRYKYKSEKASKDENDRGAKTFTHNGKTFTMGDLPKPTDDTDDTEE